MKTKFYKLAFICMAKFILWYENLLWVRKKTQKERDEEWKQFVMNALIKSREV